MDLFSVKLCEFTDCDFDEEQGQLLFEELGNNGG